MYARSTTIHADPSKIDEGIAYVRDEVMPALDRLDGSAGLSMLVDRDSGRCVVTSGWTTEEAMRASNEALTPLRERGGKILGGSPQVDEWELAVLHRVRPAADGRCLRGTRLQMDPSDLDHGIDTYRTTSVPEMEVLPGFCSASLLVDRATGRAISSVVFDSRESMGAGREQANRMRTTGADKARAQVVEVAEFDLAIAALRAPDDV